MEYSSFEDLNACALSVKPIIFLILALWQYCDKIDDKVDLCSWAYKDEKTGATRVNLQE